MKRRNTKTSRLVLSAFQSSHSALNYEMIENRLRGKADKATIYRILNRFSEDGIVHRIAGDDGKQYFALCVRCKKRRHRHNHFHFRCQQCGKVECLTNEVEPALPKGYIAEAFHGIISGYCNQCSRRSANPA